MKKLLALLLFCAVTAQCGDMFDSLSQYRNQVKRNLNVDVSSVYVSDTVANELIREAVMTVNPTLRTKKTRVTLTLVNQQANYDLDSLIGVTAVLWVKNDILNALRYAPIETWPGKIVQTTSNQSDLRNRLPTNYDYIDGELYLFPVPTYVDGTIWVIGWQKINNLDSISDLSMIPDSYRIPILRCATWLVAKAKQHPLTNEFHEAYLESMKMLDQTLNTRGTGNIEAPPER